MENFNIMEIIETIQSLKEENGALKKENEAYKQAYLNNKIARRLCPSESEETKDLYEALAKAQGEMGTAKLNRENSYLKSKYADLSSIIECSKGPLSKHSLAVIQRIKQNHEGHNILHTRLVHSSGQWIESAMRICPPRDDIHSFGSYLTYLRRYSYGALLRIVSDEETEDDDGEAVMKKEKRRLVSKAVEKVEESTETITEEQLEQLDVELKGSPQLVNEILNGLKINKLEEMPKIKFLPSLNRIKQIKQANYSSIKGKACN